MDLVRMGRIIRRSWVRARMVRKRSGRRRVVRKVRQWRRSWWMMGKMRKAMGMGVGHRSGMRVMRSVRIRMRKGAGMRMMRVVRVRMVRVMRKRMMRVVRVRMMRAMRKRMCHLMRMRRWRMVGIMRMWVWWRRRRRVMRIMRMRMGMGMGLDRNDSCRNKRLWSWRKDLCQVNDRRVRKGRVRVRQVVSRVNGQQRVRPVGVGVGARIGQKQVRLAQQVRLQTGNGGEGGRKLFRQEPWRGKTGSGSIGSCDLRGEHGIHNCHDIGRRQRRGWRKMRVSYNRSGSHGSGHHSGLRQPGVLRRALPHRGLRRQGFHRRDRRLRQGRRNLGHRDGVLRSGDGLDDRLKDY